MLYRVLLALALVAPLGANAQRFSGITEDCAELRANAAREGVLCHVGEFMGKATLYILVVPREGEPGVDRARKNIRVLRRNFYADGGTQMLTRSVDKTGRTWETYCSRNARFPSGICNDPTIVEKSDAR